MTTTTDTTQAPSPPVTGRRQRGTSLANTLLDNIVWLLLVVFAVLAGSLNSFFLSLPNFQNILVQATTLGFLALAVSIALLIGEIDLSVVGTLGFSGAIGAILLQQGTPGGLAILAALGVGAFIGLLNGICVAKLRMNSLITTLAMGLTLGGAVLAVTQGETITITDSTYRWIGSGRIATWPVMPLALVVIFLVMGVVLGRTAWGRRVYATGGNPRAAFAAGINIDRVRIQAFVVSGLLAGAAGWLTTAYLSGVNATIGANLLLYAIAAPVIGGVSLLGGRGRVLGILGGTLLLTVVQVGLQIVNISAYYVAMVGGGMIFLAVFVDAVRIRRRES